MRRNQRPLDAAVPLRGSRFLVGRGSAFIVRHHSFHFDSMASIALITSSVSSDPRSAMIADVGLPDLSRRIILITAAFIVLHSSSMAFIPSAIFMFIVLVCYSTVMPNQSPEPTAVGAVRSAVAGGGFMSAVAQLHTLGIAAMRSYSPPQTQPCPIIFSRCGLNGLPPHLLHFQTGRPASFTTERFGFRG